jgi:hypothetical protein
MKQFGQILILYLLLFVASLTKTYGQCTPNSINFIGGEPVYNFACGNESYQKIIGTVPTGSDQTYRWEVSFAGRPYSLIVDGSNVPITTIELSKNDITNYILAPNSRASGDYRIRRIVTDNSPSCISISELVFLYYAESSASITGGTILGATQICSGTSGTLTLQGHTGPVLQWESKTGSNDWIPIANTANYQYSYSNLTSSTCFRALVDNICERTNVGIIDGSDKYSDNFCVTVNELPTAIVTAPSPICSGQDVVFTITGTPGDSVTYNIGGGASLTVIIGTGGSETITVTAATADQTLNLVSVSRPSTTCSQAITESATVTVNPLPMATITADGSTTFCLGGSVTLTASAGTSWLWSTGATSQAITVSTGGSYNVTVTNSTNCSATSVATVVTVNPLPAANAGANRAICSGSSTTIGATAVSGSTYSWTSASSGFFSSEANPTVSPLVNTTYSVTETITATGCNETNNVSVTVNPLPQGGLSSDTICLGDVGQFVFIAEPDNGTGLFTLIINSVTYSSVTAGTAFDISPNPTTTTNYTLTSITDENGCVRNADINSSNSTITVNPVPAANAGVNMVICSGLSTTIGAVAGIGSTYSWTSSSSGFSSTEANPTVSPLVNTTYSLTETNTDTGCTKTNSVTVTVNPLPAANAGANRAICSGLSTTIGAAAVTGSTYSWTSSSSGFTSTEANLTVSPLVNTTYSLTETITATGCTETNNVFVTVNPLPAADASVNMVICSGSSTTIGAVAVSGSMYSWTSSSSGFSSTEANPTVSPLINTTYSVTEIITATGCTMTNSVTVTVNQLPAANAGANTAICIGLSTTIGAAAVSGSTYSWTSVPSGFFSSEANPLVSPLVNTTYLLTETIIATGCTETNNVSVTVNPLPSANAGANRAICTYFAISQNSS